MRIKRILGVGFATLLFFALIQQAQAIDPIAYQDCLKAAAGMDKTCLHERCTWQACMSMYMQSTRLHHGGQLNTGTDPGMAGAAEAACGPHYQRLQQCSTAHASSYRPDEKSRIKILKAIYGENCPSSSDVTAHLAQGCNDLPSCGYRVDHVTIGDPSFGCRKTYHYYWQCSKDGSRHEAVVSPEASGQSAWLECP